ncbi:MAG TPA: hypothetical protein VLZ83_00830 [Edaphocola sp.]|nr:hypothetical protein [Edaphocola sp.]
MKVFNQVKDPVFVNDKMLISHAFQLESFLHPNSDSNSSIQYILPSDVIMIVEKTKELFVIFYYPNCPSAESYFQLAKAAEDKNIPVLLLSFFNNPHRMKEWYSKIELKNKNLYIIPSSDSFDARTFTKVIQFVAQVCPSSYEKYRDELKSTDYILIKNNECQLNFVDTIYGAEDGLEWLEAKLLESK